MSEHFYAQHGYNITTLHISFFRLQDDCPTIWCCTFDDIISSVFDYVNMNWVPSCDLDIADIKLFDNVAL